MGKKDRVVMVNDDRQRVLLPREDSLTDLNDKVLKEIRGE